MKTRFLLPPLALLVLTAPLSAKLTPPWRSQDIGKVKTEGAATDIKDVFTIQASGKDIYGTEDSFHFVHQPLEGDGQIIARVTALENTNTWAKTGVMIRESLEPNSKHAMMIVTAGSGSGAKNATSFQHRVKTGGETTFTPPRKGELTIYVRLTRVGDTFEGYQSKDGKRWMKAGTIKIKMGKKVRIGLCLTAHDNDEVNTASLDKVRIGDVPPPPKPPPAPAGPKTGWIPLFNGNDFSNWYTYLEDEGVDKDPDGVLKVEDGLIHLLDLDDLKSRQHFGYFATLDEYSNYRLRFQYKWGTKKYPPRDKVLRDSGLLYHMKGRDRIWPTCLESQVQEGDTGDYFILSGPKIDTTVQPGSNRYQAGGEPKKNHGGSVVHSEAYDHLTGWNTVETIVTEDEGIHLVNGQVNNRGTNFRLNDKPLTQGKIAIQVEGAEVFYRNIEIMPLFTQGGGPEYRVLVFSLTKGFRHDSIPAGIEAMKKLGVGNGFAVDATEDPTVFNVMDLAKYQAVVFLNTTGDVLNEEQQAAFEHFVRKGGGYVGVHSASDTEYDWPWYGKLVGAYFSGHPAVQSATIKIEDFDHPSTSSLANPWVRRDEWYDFKSSPRPNVKVLASLDQGTYKGAKMKDDHPISWYHEFDGGRAFYTGMGHTKETFTEPTFLIHLLGGLEWAAGVSGGAPLGATVLFDGSSTSSWKPLKGEGEIDWPVLGDALEVNSGDIVTKENYGDCRLHLEFRPPSSKEDDASRGNSGVYLMGRYELQIFDSFNYDLEGERNDCGAIYGVKDPDQHVAWPADAWQTFDIDFRAPRWDGDKKTANARMTVYWNGVLVHKDVEIPGPTTAAGFKESPQDGPIQLQSHGSKVRFRNIWISK